MKKLIDVVFSRPHTLFSILIAVMGITFLVAPVYAGGFTQTNLVSDQPGVAIFTDPNLVNAWGIVADEEGVFWIADNHTGLVTTYGRDGTPLAVTFVVPPPEGSPEGTVAAPTGLVDNDSRGFAICEEGRMGRSFKIVATEDGTISGWNPFVDTDDAILKVDRSGSGAVYKGLTIASNKFGAFIYATNFNAGTVDVFDSKWNRVTKFPFADRTIPAGYAPFGIRLIGETIFVTYAKQDAAKHDDDKGPGHGFINTFTTDGRLIGRFASMGALNSPWGLTLAPDSIGRGLRLDCAALLVGNFGDGRINIFSLKNGAFLGPLRNTFGDPIQVDGLWGLDAVDEMGDAARTKMDDHIFFTAGPNGEANGLFGVQTAR